MFPKILIFPQINIWQLGILHYIFVEWFILRLNITCHCVLQALKVAGWIKLSIVDREQAEIVKIDREKPKNTIVWHGLKKKIQFSDTHKDRKAETTIVWHTEMQKLQLPDTLNCRNYNCPTHRKAGTTIFWHTERQKLQLSDTPSDREKANTNNCLTLGNNNKTPSICFWRNSKLWI